MREYVRDRDRLEHIVEAIDNILNYSSAKTIPPKRWQGYLSVFVLSAG